KLPLAPEIKNCMVQAGRARIAYLNAYRVVLTAPLEPKPTSEGTTKHEPPEPVPSNPSTAPTDAASVLRAFGLVGPFSPDCAVEPSNGGRVSIWTATPDGKVEVVVQQGIGRSITSDMRQFVSERRISVRAAQRISDSEIVVITNEKTGENEIVFEKLGPSYRDLRITRLSDGNVIANDGIILSSGERMPLMHPCGDDQRRRAEVRRQPEAPEPCLRWNA